jgi:hypothetical protein
VRVTGVRIVTQVTCSPRSRRLDETLAGGLRQDLFLMEALVISQEACSQVGGLQKHKSFRAATIIGLDVSASMVEQQKQ